MVVTAEELTLAGSDTPMLVGGAALTRNFTMKRIAPAYSGLCAYAKDAMNGLELANRIVTADGRASSSARSPRSAAKLADREAKAAVVESGEAPRGPAMRRCSNGSASAPDHERHVIEQLAARRGVDAHQPEDALRQAPRPEGQLRRADRARATAAPRAEGADRQPQGASRAAASPMTARAVWQFFPAASGRHAAPLRAEGCRSRRRRVHVPAAGQGRSPLPLRLHAPGRRRSQARFVCLFVVTAGEGMRERAERSRRRASYLKSHAIQALAHRDGRGRGRVAAHAAARRSGASPICPTSHDGPLPGALPRQALQLRLSRVPRARRSAAALRGCCGPRRSASSSPRSIMMEPEASVSALVFHHPDAKYFSVGKEHL